MFKVFLAAGKVDIMLQTESKGTPVISTSAFHIFVYKLLLLSVENNWDGMFL